MTREYAAAVAELGGEVRTLDEFFNRMIVVDRRVAVIPAPDDLSVALTIREPTVVAYLVDVFLRAWERARPFSSRDDKAMRQIAEEQRAMTMRMLIEGHSDPVSAKRLGVSPRTYAATSPTQGGVRGGDPVPAGLHDRAARHHNRVSRLRRLLSRHPWWGQLTWSC